MRIKIFTFYQNNFGAILQACALKTILEQYADCSIYKTKTRNFLYYRLRAILARLIQFNWRAVAFELKKLIILSKFIKSLESEDSILNLKSDILVFGSDEIWNAKRRECYSFPIMWGKGLEEYHKISYAPSANTATEDDYIANGNLHTYLESFDYLSVRDRHTQLIVQKLINRQVDIVLDPTMLLTREWYFAKSDKINEDNYIALYAYTSQIANNTIALLRSVASIMGKSIISLAFFRKWCDKNIIGANVFDYYINADYVITTTFHGAVFAIIHEKQFIVLSKSSNKINDLLETFGLEDRNIQSEDSAVIISKLKTPIDYAEVRSILAKRRAYSLAFIDKAMRIIMEGMIMKVNNMTLPTDRINCTGCLACKWLCPFNAIIIATDHEGFKIPLIDQNLCTGCGKCKQVCPQNKRSFHFNENISVKAVRYKDDAVLRNCASGGVFAGIAKAVLDDGNGTVFGCAFDETITARHIRITRISEITPLQSSKYVQSDIDNSYILAKVDLENGKNVLFSGTSCQIAGLYAYLGKDYDNLCTIELVCHGVPSPLFFKKYIAWLGKKYGGNIIFYDFRSKDKLGWGMGYKTKTKTKTKYPNPNVDAYYNAFLKNKCLRECCYQCKYKGSARVGDLTIGDYWGIDKVHPEFFDNRGVSVLLINTPQGQRIWDLVANVYDSMDSAFESASRQIKMIISSAKRPDDRDWFYNGIERSDYMSLPQFKFSFGSKLVNELKTIIKCVLPNSLVAKYKSRKGRLKD